MGESLAKRSVTVLGVHDGHDAGAALIRDGKVLAALQEERPRNIKHYSGIPARARTGNMDVRKLEFGFSCSGQISCSKMICEGHIFNKALGVLG